MIEQTCSEIAEKALDRQYALGMIVGIISVLSGWGITGLPEFFRKKKKMLTEMQYLIDRNDGIVTVADLVIAAKVSPEKATKFLVSFAQKLETEPEVESETGTRFYRFNNASQISKRLYLAKSKNG